MFGISSMESERKRRENIESFGFALTEHLEAVRYFLEDACYNEYFILHGCNWERLIKPLKFGVDT